MIYSVSGKVIKKSSDFAVIEASGVGYKINIATKKTKVLKEGEKAKVFCSFQILKDSIELFGFASEKELELFETLISIDGIGPRAGQKIIGESDEKALFAAAEKGDVAYFENLPGIGRKKAGRIVLELQEKLGQRRTITRRGNAPLLNDVMKALKNLGYAKKEIDEALQDVSEKETDFDRLLKSALKFLAKK